jgi:nucleotide-binding universal stress UspA family protein
VSVNVPAESLGAAATRRRTSRRRHRGAPPAAALSDEAVTGRGPVLLATEGREFPAASVALAADLAGSGGTVHVFAITRVHGVAFGLPNPGLLPTKAEWDAQRTHVASAVKALRRRGLTADGEVMGTRKSTARICQAADRLACSAIVMGADPPRQRFIANLMWSQEPYRVKRRAKVPVHLVVDNAGTLR